MNDKKINVLVGACLLLLLQSCQITVVKTRYDNGDIQEKIQVYKKRGTRNGFYRLFYENGQLALEQEFKNGKIIGEERGYYESGQLESVFQAKDGTYHGPFQFYHENGVLYQEGTYMDNEMEGELRTYYENGQLKEIIQMKKTHEHGPFVMYHDNGQVKMKGKFVNGEHYDGELKVYSSDGQLLRIQDCNRGDCETLWIWSGTNQSPKPKDSMENEDQKNK
ncbi:MAG: toxin-antitoxin system YwqK family antitoxin [Saprospiraceae bacterium]|nr:toxin-antitoxin system YwqK family antitoxin [Saprospiraceae bacterium]